MRKGVFSEAGLRGWAIAAAVTFVAAVAALLLCIFSGAFDFEPISRPIPALDTVSTTYEEVNGMEIRPIAHIRSDFGGKFGIPRQSGVVPELVSYVVFEPEFRNDDALRGIDGYDYLWLIWEFSANRHESWSPTVRPPRLGGNVRQGVFATRSPYRPNPLGLSSVRLDAVLRTDEGSVLRVLGADLLDGTPIYDIKPYIEPDVHAGARFGFSGGEWERGVEVVFPDELLSQVPEDRREALKGVLEQDPRPAYQHDPERVYGLTFAGKNIRFTVSGGKLTVISVE